MNGKAFLDVARELARGRSEAHRRSAVSRAYYALFLKAREALRRWGWSVPQREAHRAVKLILLGSSDAAVKDVGMALGQLAELRSKSDYDLSDLARLFATPKTAHTAVDDAVQAIALLDAVESDPACLASAVESLNPR